MKTFLTTWAAAAVLMLAGCSRPEPADAYLFSYFNGNGDGLHLAYSYDGLHWQAMNGDRPLIAPLIGNQLMRDPSICQGPDGKFHLVWTSGWTDQGIGYASSDDLITWSEQREIPVMKHIPTTLHAWAPEVYYNADEELFYIIWASSFTTPEAMEIVAAQPKGAGMPRLESSPNILYYITTRDFESFSEAEEYFHPDFGVIDGAVIKKDDRYWFIVKNEDGPELGGKNLRVTFSERMADGFPTAVSENISGEQWAEGPTPLQRGDYVYVFFDKYRDKRYGAIRSLDGTNWEEVSETVSFPQGIRHGTAFRVPGSVLEKLLAHDAAASAEAAPQAR